MKRTATGYVCTVAVLLLLVCSAIGEAQEPKIFRLGGAALFSEVMEAYGKIHERSHPECKLALLPGTTGEGFAKLINGEVDLVMASRHTNDTEKAEANGKGLELTAKSLGMVGVAVIVNAGNPIPQLTMDQLRRVFIGEVTNWSEVGGSSEAIRVTTRAVPKSGPGVIFQQVVLKGAPYATGSQVMPSYQATAQVCRKSPGAVGYMPACTNWFKSVEYTGVRVVPLRLDPDAVAFKPDFGVVRKTPYPIVIPFYLYWNAGAPNKCVSEFVDFAMTQVR